MSAFDARLRGLHGMFRRGERNHCPGCGRSHWIIGRSTAECAFCSTALPLEDSAPASAGLVRRSGKGGGRVLRMVAA